MGSFPDPGGYNLAKLKKGDEITLAPGFGNPKSEETRTLVIYSIREFSALCTDGTRLNCFDGNAVAKTGRRVRAKPNKVARQILFDTNVRSVKAWIDDVGMNINNKIWLIGYRIRRLRAKKV